MPHEHRSRDEPNGSDPGDDGVRVHGSRPRGGAVGAGQMRSAHNLMAVQSYLERTERDRAHAALEFSRVKAEVDVKRGHLADAARDRQAIDKLKERRKAEHDAEWARKSQNTLDELALAVHRRGGALAA